MSVITGVVVAVGAAYIGTSIYNSYKAGQAHDDAMEIAEDNQVQQNEIAEQQLAFQKEEAKKLEAQKNVYRSMVFKNPYADVKNFYADIQNPFRDLQTDFENVYEDLTVNQQQAEFQRDTMAQQRANIMGQMRGAAGGSGIAGLAQAMANQGQLATQQVSASIGQQEAMNQRLRAQGAAQVQSMEAQREQLIAQGAYQADITRARGESAADMARRGGEASLQEMEMSRQATLLGIQMGQTTGANQALQQAYANQMMAGAGMANLMGQQSASLYGLAGSYAQAGGQMIGSAASDRRLKKNINKIGESSSGLNIYSFEFKDSKYGEGVFQGVMSDEIPQKFVRTINGYDIVDYSMLDVEFKQI
tara:strand:- start:1818 stop:2900 length:1083 start_codon:yes stop_codon:yes gene_type:complete